MWLWRNVSVCVFTQRTFTSPGPWPLSKFAWAPHVTDAPRCFASAPTKPVARLIEPHRPARPVRRDVDVRLRVAARRSGPASAAHDLSRGGRPRPRRCAIPDSQRGVSPRCASSETTRPTRSRSPAPLRPRRGVRGPTRRPSPPPRPSRLGTSRPYAPSALHGLAPMPLVPTPRPPRAPATRRGA